MDKHWTVNLSEDVLTHLDNEVRSDPKHLSIECRVMQRTQSQPIRNHRLAARVAIWQDVRCVQ
jgi:hypothetical protein